MMALGVVAPRWSLDLWRGASGGKASLAARGGRRSAATRCAWARRRSRRAHTIATGRGGAGTHAAAPRRARLLLVEQTVRGDAGGARFHLLVVLLLLHKPFELKPRGDGDRVRHCAKRAAVASLGVGE